MPLESFHFQYQGLQKKLGNARDSLNETSDRDY